MVYKFAVSFVSILDANVTQHNKANLRPRNLLGPDTCRTPLAVGLPAAFASPWQDIVLGSVESMANPPTDISVPVFVATYVEAMPGDAAAALDVLRQSRDANRGAAGNLRCDLLERLAQPNQFVVLEAWQSEGPAAGPVDEKLQPFLLSPCDVRSHGGFAVGPADHRPAEALPDATVYAVTHVDVVPPHKDEGVALLALKP